jgi:predicted RNase H-like HicB family nuclease
MNKIKIIVEQHSDGFVGYPLGLKGVVIGQGDSYEEALEDTKSAINFHIESFGTDAFDYDSEVLEVFVADSLVA